MLSPRHALIMKSIKNYFRATKANLPYEKKAKQMEDEPKLVMEKYAD